MNFASMQSRFGLLSQRLTAASQAIRVQQGCTTSSLSMRQFAARTPDGSQEKATRVDDVRKMFLEKHPDATNAGHYYNQIEGDAYD